ARPTRFPYTTLFRSDRCGEVWRESGRPGPAEALRDDEAPFVVDAVDVDHAEHRRQARRDRACAGEAELLRIGDEERDVVGVLLTRRYAEQGCQAARVVERAGRVVRRPRYDEQQPADEGEKSREQHDAGADVLREREEREDRE